MDSKMLNTQILLPLNLINYNNDFNKIIKELYTISNNVENNYNVFRIKKHSGKTRIIYEPKSNLKYIQRQILINILNKREISKYAKAYHKGISLRDNALPHINKKLILKLDIENFFESIRFEKIYFACFNELYFPKGIGVLLTKLCTYVEYLPQGAPTSAYIANLVMKDFDEELGNWCAKNSIAYTRYSDDMTFSGTFIPSDIIKRVRKMLYKLGLKLNNRKIHVINSSHRQSVTGIVVNKKLQVNASYRKKIRQEIYYIKRYGLLSHFRRLNYQGTIDSYIANLYGRVLFCLQIRNDDLECQKYKNYLKGLLANIKNSNM